jgi:arginine utilization protein RocB
VIVGLAPPYYPGVSCHDRPDFESMITVLATRLEQYGRVKFNQEYEHEAFFTGISDLSYSSLAKNRALELETIIAG